jgi:predicted nucleotidyltransferase
VNALFTRVQSRVLGIIFGHPDRAFQITDVIALAESGRGAVQRELEKLSRAGVIESTKSGGRKLYQANRRSPIFKEIHSLIRKTVGLLDPIRNALAPHRGKIHVAFVFGSVPKGRDTANSDIDLMIIGDELAYSEIYAALQKAERLLARPINPNLMTPAEWKRKRNQKNSFLTRVLEQPKLFAVGTEDELDGLG